MNIKHKERETILAALRSGVVPAIGLQHIQVGRAREVESMIAQLDCVADGGAAVRFVSGPYGAGKSFFLHLLRAVALERRFLCVRADITLDRRLHATDGKARALITELIANMSTKSRPAGGAVQSLLEAWLSGLQVELGEADSMESEVRRRLHALEALVGNYDFRAVVLHYFHAHVSGDQESSDAALRWLRAEYGTKTEARRALAVRNIVEDATTYDYLKLLAKFARIAGYAGLVVCIDELGVLAHRMKSTQARNANYEALLRIVNDCLQGQVEGLMFVFGAVDTCIEDRRCGLASYEALATRLAPGEFDDGSSLSGPVIRLQTLTPEDQFVLLQRLRHVHAGGIESKYTVPDEGLEAFLEHAYAGMGARAHTTTRDITKRFVSLLDRVSADPSADWRSLLQTDTGPAAGGLEELRL